MEIKYPVEVSTRKSLSIGEAVRLVDKDRYLRAHSQNMAPREVEFLRQLVADANEAATVKADYERLGKKIDDMVEERTRLLKHENDAVRSRNARLESDAFVDSRTIAGLRAAGSVVQDDNRKLGAENRRLKEEIGELLAARDLLSVKLDRVEKEYADTRLSPAKRRFIKHKDGDPNNNDIGNLEIDYAPGGVTWVSEVDPALAGRLNAAEKMSAHLQAASDTLDTLDPKSAAHAAVKRLAMQEQERSNVFYRDLAELLAKTFGVRFPFPKQHSEESEL